jgi:ABC-2 type transport system permease protein
MKKDLKETFHTKAFYVSIGLVIFVVVMLIQAIGDPLTSLVKEAEVTAVQALLGTFSFALSLMLMLLFCIYINAYTLMLEKMKRSLEALLCTPLSLNQIMLGKTFALFLPSVILAWLFTFASLAGINWFFITPELGKFVMPGAAPLVAIFIVVPAIFLLISLMIVELQLIITNIRWVNAVIMGAIFGVGFGLSASLQFGHSSWNVVLILLGVGAILALITKVVSWWVNKERIVLSSKG